MSVKRLNVNINEQQYKQLKLKALLDGVTLSELVKTWITNYLQTNDRKTILRSDSK